MKRNQKLEHLVDSLSKQNKSVSDAVDGMIEYVTTSPDADLRSDWSELQKTTELIVVQDLVFGQQSCEGPQAVRPKSIGESKSQKNGQERQAQEE